VLLTGHPANADRFPSVPPHPAVRRSAMSTRSVPAPQDAFGKFFPGKATSS
jgi:hypothetical protein